MLYMDVEATVDTTQADVASLPSFVRILSELPVLENTSCLKRSRGDSRRQRLCVTDRYRAGYFCVEGR